MHENVGQGTSALYLLQKLCLKAATLALYHQWLFPDSTSLKSCLSLTCNFAAGVELTAHQLEEPTMLLVKAYNPQAELNESEAAVRCQAVVVEAHMPCEISK